MMTPCTQKLNAAKKKHFNKYVLQSKFDEPTNSDCSAKPVQLFASQNETEELSEEDDEQPKKEPAQSNIRMEVDEENPF